MVFVTPGPHRGDAASEPVTLKVLVAGDLGVGKTTLVGSVSEIGPLRTEEVLTETGRPLDGPEGRRGRETGERAATVVVDFGRITLSGTLTLCLLGTPVGARSRPLWDELVRGALGAVLLVDPRRPEDHAGAIGHFERHAVPYVVAANRFGGADHGPMEGVRAALDLDREVPVLRCDARERDSVRRVLLSVVEHAMLLGAARRRDALA